MNGAIGSPTQRLIGALMLVAALAYLVPFVPRGWIPHDEGMLGQSADRVLHGGVPHVDYEEGYTGGLSYFYAAVFKVSGVDLLHLRRVLFGGAALALWLTYAMLRRYLEPVAAAFGAWVALAWSFPNYFAPLPSWWLLICALACLWAFLRYLETDRLLHLALAGVAAGIAVAVKQTGLYLLVAVVMAVLYRAGESEPRSSTPIERLALLVTWAVGILSVAAAAIILAPRIFEAEGLFLFFPIAACAVALLLAARERRVSTDASGFAASMAPVFQRFLLVPVAAALPIALLLLPYVIHHRLWDLVNGAVLLPRKRLAFASAPMPPAAVIIMGLPLLGLVLPTPRRLAGMPVQLFELLMWSAALVLPILSLWYLVPYQLIWQSTRAFAALLPPAICYRLARRRGGDLQQSRFLFASAAILAWTSLNQFPFAAPIYFCYVTPLAVVAGIALCGTNGRPFPRVILPWAIMVLLFMMLSSHRAYIESLGVFHSPRWFNTKLNLPRAHLKVGSNDALTYRRLVSAITSHFRGGELIAGPDCPEVYFLSGLVNPSGALFDFFSDPSGSSDGGFSAWSKGDVIVLNHQPEFSPGPSRGLVEQLRTEFPNGESIGKFEVRWR